MSNDESEHKYHFSNALISKDKWARAFGRPIGRVTSIERKENSLDFTVDVFGCEEERQDEN